MLLILSSSTIVVCCTLLAFHASVCGMCPTLSMKRQTDERKKNIRYDCNIISADRINKLVTVTKLQKSYCDYDYLQSF